MIAKAERSEAGLTLIEVLITVMVMGIAFAVLLGGMATTVLSSGLHKQQAIAEVELRKYAEIVKQAPFASSDTARRYGLRRRSGLLSYLAPSGFTADVTRADCFDAAGTSAPSCSSNVVQLVTLAFSSDDTRVTESLVVAKRSS